MNAVIPLSPEQDMESQMILLFIRLQRPIDAENVKWRWGDQKKTFKLHYVTARTVMNRLDEVLGPENWWDDYIPYENSVVCRLSIRLPDGRILTKSDAGGPANMADPGDDDKSAYSDAFKRAAVKFGIARELYKDGVAKLRIASGTDRAPEPEPEPDPEPEPEMVSSGGTAVPAQVRSFWDVLVSEVDRANDLWQKKHGNSEEIAHWADAVLHMATVTHGARFHKFDPEEFSAEAGEWVGTLIEIANDPNQITVSGELMSKREWMMQHLNAWLADQWKAAIRRRAGIAPAAG